MTTTITIRPRVDDDISAAAQALQAIHRIDSYPVEGVAEPGAWLSTPFTLGAWVADDVTISSRPGGAIAGHIW